MYACKKCEHTWTPKRKTKPKRCPKCQTIFWETGERPPLKNPFTCLRCGHMWEKRKDVHPKICPKCKSKVWDIKKTKRIKVEKGTAPKHVNDYILNNF